MSGDTLAQQFEQLEYHGSSDQQLLELKAKMGLIGGAQGDAEADRPGRCDGAGGRRTGGGATQVVIGRRGT